MGHEEKLSVRGFLVDPIPNFPKYIIRIVWQTVRRITKEILGLKD